MRVALLPIPCRERGRTFVRAGRAQFRLSPNARVIRARLYCDSAASTSEDEVLGPNTPPCAAGAQPPTKPASIRRCGAFDTQPLAEPAAPGPCPRGSEPARVSPIEQIAPARAKLLPRLLVYSGEVAPPDLAQPSPGFSADQVIRGDRTRVDRLDDLPVRRHGSRLGRFLRTRLAALPRTVPVAAVVHRRNVVRGAERA